MNDKNFKSPKLNKKRLFGDGSEPVLWGAMITLISLIGLLGKGPVGSLLTFLAIYMFGAYYFLLYLILIIFGVYLMIKRKVLRIQIGMKFLGAIFILIACLIASSSIGKNLQLNNFAKEYQNDINLIKVGNYFELDITEISGVGGGFIGYFLCALFNSTISSAGTVVVYVTLMVLGLILLLKDIVIYLINFFIGLKHNPGEKRIKKDKKTDEKSISATQELKIEREKNINQKYETNEFSNKLISEINKTPIQEYKQTTTSFDENKPSMNVTKTSFFVNDLDDFMNEKTVNNSFNNNVTPKYNKNNVESESNAVLDNKLNMSHQYVPFSKTNEEVVEEESVEMNKKSIEKEQIVKKDYEQNANNNVFVKDESVIKPIQDDDIFLSQSVEMKKSEVKFSKTDGLAEIEEEKPVELKQYIFPPINLLKNRVDDSSEFENIQVANERLGKINELFEQFNIGAQVISYNIGPSVTRFNIKMNKGVKVNTLSSYQNEVAIKLGGNKTVRLDLVVEGQETSALEVGNKKASPVSFRECFASIMNRQDEKLLVPLGKDISGNVVTINIDELPHLLVAGTTGSGKSVFINGIITTLIMRNRPDELKLMLIDPKKVEFSKYNNLPHLLCPVITEPNDGKVALGRLVDEMERRYTLFLEKGRGATKLSEYAAVCRKYGYEIPPSIVMVCDEFSDFMTENKKEIETYVKRLAQKARAAGIYLIICTQRPSVQVITGDIKAVIPSRIGLSVPSVVDSRTILDEGGAESLLGNGDMLARIPRHNSLVRVQGSYIGHEEIMDVCDYIKNQRQPDYDKNFLNLKETTGTGEGGEMRKGRDELHEKAKEHVMRTKIASTSNLQSAFSIGYARADHILYCLEEEGIVKRVSGNRRIVVKTLDDNNE